VSLSEARMSHLAFYDYQATARGIRTVADVKRNASEKAYLYDRIVAPRLSADKQRRIVELACGHGAFLCWLRERGYSNVEGVDASIEQIRFAEQVAVAHQAEVNGWLAAQQPSSCAVLVAVDLIEHMPKDAFMEFLANAYRVLEAQGTLILRYPNGDSPIVGRNLFNDITHVWTYTPVCLKALAAMHGFRGVDFVDESHSAIRDQRWLKVPLCRMACRLLKAVFRAATRETIEYWSPHLWAFLVK
jgi:cyclopropane fatty-acyl-phospholipid synthase-like methyltransferase